MLNSTVSSLPCSADTKAPPSSSPLLISSAAAATETGAPTGKPGTVVQQPSLPKLSGFMVQLSPITPEQLRSSEESTPAFLPTSAEEQASPDEQSTSAERPSPAEHFSSADNELPTSAEQPSSSDDSRKAVSSPVEEESPVANTDRSGSGDVSVACAVSESGGESEAGGTVDSRHVVPNEGIDRDVQRIVGGIDRTDSGVDSYDGDIAESESVTGVSQNVDETERDPHGDSEEACVDIDGMLEESEARDEIRGEIRGGEREPCDIGSSGGSELNGASIPDISDGGVASTTGDSGSGVMPGVVGGDEPGQNVEEFGEEEDRVSVEVEDDVGFGVVGEGIVESAAKEIAKIEASVSTDELIEDGGRGGRAQSDSDVKDEAAMEEDVVEKGEEDGDTVVNSFKVMNADREEGELDDESMEVSGTQDGDVEEKHSVPRALEEEEELGASQESPTGVERTDDDVMDIVSSDDSQSRQLF